ncbi:MAG: hypothetical protein P8I82_07785 [Flavobacteriales bacterium]|nr:hypothetical protein [Flavobacteriales bacterium]
MSTLFWFLIKFSKEYTYYIDYPLEYVNQPIDKYLKEQPLSELKIKVKGHGFAFLKETFFNRNADIDLSKLQRQGSTSFALSQALRPNIARELNGFSILDIEPDTLFLDFSIKTSATLKVSVPLDLSFSENYVQYGDFKVVPQEIEVFGPAHILDTLTRLYTDVLKRDDISENIDVSLEAILPNAMLTARNTAVKVSQEVARFTEIHKKIPIQLINVPTGKELIVKPSEVDLSYWIAMKDVAKVKASDFVIYCDYDEIAMTQRKILNIFLDENKKPSIVQRVKFHPSTVEFVKKN